MVLATVRLVIVEGVCDVRKACQNTHRKGLGEMNHGKGTRLCRCGKLLPGESSSTRQWLFICEPFASSAQALIPAGTTSGETRGLKIVGGQVQLRICRCIVQSVPHMEVVLHRREGRSLRGGGSSITFK